MNEHDTCADARAHHDSPAVKIDEAAVNTGGPSGDMSLRDYFAGQALIAQLRTEFVSFHKNGFINAEDAATAACNCYAIADAMLAEREK